MSFHTTEQEKPQNNDAYLLLLINYLLEINRRTTNSVGDVVSLSERHNLGWIRWEAVRSGGAPIIGYKGQRFTGKTGFEGYFVGGSFSKNGKDEKSINSPEILASALLQVGKESLDSIRLRHRHSLAEKRMLEATILGTGFSVEAATEWAAIFAARLAFLRMNLFSKSGIKAREFRAETDAATQGLSKVAYTFNNDGRMVAQKCDLPRQIQQQVEVSLQAGTDEERMYREIVLHLGYLGHPLVRVLLDMLN